MLPKLASNQFVICYVNAMLVATCRTQPDLLAGSKYNIWHTNCDITGHDGGTGRLASASGLFSLSPVKPATQGRATVTMQGFPVNYS